MSRLLYLEPIGGIAGDMFLAAALDLGVQREELTRALFGLNLAGWKLELSRTVRHEITANHLEVVVDEQKAEHLHRTLRDIRSMIEACSTMSAPARQRALAIFEVIGQAEAKIHGVPLDSVQFHEVGAVDSIIDICGASVALELMGNPEVFSSPPPLGSGSVKSAHGTIPVPAPATLEILKDVPVRFEGLGELTTPTGAAILKTVARVGAPPEMLIERVGYGAGTKDFKDRPNLLRASLGTSAHAGASGTFVIEANLDDASPQLLGALIESLLEFGSLDAYVVPVTMKKNRPGHLLGVVVAADRREQVVSKIFAESTTLGLRTHRVERTALERRFEEVATPYGKVRIKLGLENGRVVNAQPEFEDCRALAASSKTAVKQVWAEALAAYYRK